jgi:hypothetical protein
MNVGSITVEVKVGPILHRSKDIDLALGNKKPSKSALLGTFVRPTTAGLKKYLRTKSGTRRDRGRVWAWLQYRRHAQ